VGSRFLTAAALALLLDGCDGPADPTPPPPEPDVTGAWSGRGMWGFGLPTPLEMTLQDSSDSVTGTGGGVDCRYFVLCGSFYSYSVRGSHANLAITLEGTSDSGRRWTLRGTIQFDGTSMSGTGEGDDFAEGPWQMSRRQ
jgi:hypothetical protein